MKTLFYCLFWIAITTWCAGFFWFYAQIPLKQNYVDNPIKTQAIVALTGGVGRLDTALTLLKAGKADVLFISGVGKEVKFGEFTAKYGIDMTKPDQTLDGKEIVLGYQATDTIGNARETAAWMQKRKLTNMRLVTSNYHLPRSLLECRHAMPDVTILPVPVFPDYDTHSGFMLPRGPLRLLLLEYHKWLWQSLHYAWDAT